MSDELPGPHHCIGTARTVTDIVFRTLRAQCAAGGGKLSLEELDSFYSKIIDSFSSGFDLFELRHHSCMNASLGMAEMPLARERILASLLRACGEKSALAAFPLQVECLGIEWVGQVFSSLAQYVRTHVRTDIDARLIDAYVETATLPKIKMTIRELLSQEAVKNIMLECVAVFDGLGAPDSNVKNLCDWVNGSVAGQRGIGSAHICKVTEDEMRRFMNLLPRQFTATLGVSPAKARVAAPPVSAA